MDWVIHRGPVRPWAPVIRTLALAALALAGPLVAALPASAARPYVRVVSVTHVVAKNDRRRSSLGSLRPTQAATW